MKKGLALILEVTDFLSAVTPNMALTLSLTVQ